MASGYLYFSCIITAEMYPANALIQKLDMIFNQRIYLNYRNITLYGVKVFGQHVLWGTGQLFIILLRVHIVRITRLTTHMCAYLYKWAQLQLQHMFCFMQGLRKKCLKKECRDCYAL